MSEAEEVIEERERSRKHDFHMTNVADGVSPEEQFQETKAQYLDRLMKTEMTDAGINLLDNMVDRTFMLGNITAAEYHDYKWYIHGLYIKIKMNFPPKGSDVVGDIRAFILDDGDEALTPLTDQQKNIIGEMLIGLMLIVSRSKEGFQQEMNVKSISVSEVLDPEEQEDALLSGLFN